MIVSAEMSACAIRRARYANARRRNRRSTTIADLRRVRSSPRRRARPGRRAGRDFQFAFNEFAAAPVDFGHIDLRLGRLRAEPAQPAVAIASPIDSNTTRRIGDRRLRRADRCPSDRRRGEAAPSAGIYLAQRGNGRMIHAIVAVRDECASSIRTMSRCPSASGLRKIVCTVAITISAPSCCARRAHRS